MMKKIRFAAGLVAVAALSMAVATKVKAAGTPMQRNAGARAVQHETPFFADRLGRAQKATSLIGKPVVDRQGGRLGMLQDLVIDLRTGRVVCALVAEAGQPAGKGELAQVAPGAFGAADGSKVVFNYGKEELAKAPRYPKTSADDVYDYFREKPYWNSRDGVGRVRTFSEILALSVMNPKQTQDIGNVLDLMIDLPSGRILLAVLSFNGTDDTLYAVPPAALKSTSVRKELSLNAENYEVAKLSEPAPVFWPKVTNTGWVASVYRSYGEDPTSDPSLRVEIDTTKRPASLH